MADKMAELKAAIEKLPLVELRQVLRFTELLAKKQSKLIKEV